MRQTPVVEILNSFAARTPTPGGGSASALGGALGSALANMAAAFTTQNEKYKAVEPQVLALIGKLTALRAQFLDLADADIDAYGAYSSARGLPKNSPEEKAARSKALAEANERATLIPEKIALAAREGLRLTEELAAVSNPNLAGDVSVAAYFLEAAARGAGIQVLGNCASDDTEGRNKARRTAVRTILGECQSARERIDAAVLKMMKVSE
jgi:methenyltetrahydrofolate cyclohydrolase